MIACQKMADERVNDLDQELFSELTESLVQPLLVHVVPPFVDGKDENYCLQVNGNVLWEWRILEGNSKKLFAVLQKNLQPIYSKLIRDLVKEPGIFIEFNNGTKGCRRIETHQ